MADGRIEIDTRINEKGAQKGLNSLQRKVSGSAKKMQQVGGQMTKYITAPLAAVGAAGFAAADNLDKAYKSIRTGTGATGDALEALKNDFDAVFGEVPDSADKVADALANLNTYTGATGDQLQNLTEQVLDASRALEEDGANNAEAFGKALTQWQVPAEEGGKHLDNLFRLTQDYGIGLGEISGQLTEYGSVLQNAGFDMEESAELFGRLSSQGLSVSRIMPGLNKAFRDWASEGKNSKEELANLINELSTAEDGTKAFGEAVDIFGAEGVNRLKIAIDNGVFTLDDLTGGLEASQGAVDANTEATETFGDKLGTLKNQANLGLAPIGDIFLDLAENALPPVIEAVKGVADWFRNLSPVGQKVIVVIGAIIAILPPLIMLAGSLAIAIMGITWPVALVVAGIAALIAIGVLLWQNWESLKGFAISIWSAISDFFVNLFEGIKNTFNNALDWIDEKTGGSFKHITDTIRLAMETSEKIIHNILEFIKRTFSNATEFLKSLISLDFGRMKEIFQDQMQNISDLGSNILENIKGFFSDAWDNVLSRTEAFRRGFLAIWTGIKNGIRLAINPIIGFINNLIRGIETMVNAISRGINRLPSFDIPSWVPGVGGGSLSLPDVPTVSLPRVPQLNIGTDFVSKDGLAMLHRGEKVVPAEHTGPYTGKDGNKPEYIVVQMDIDGRATARALAKPIEDIQERRTIEKLRAEGRY